MLTKSRFDVPYDCSVELSALGNQFLTDIFEAYDKVSRHSVSIGFWSTSLGPGRCFIPVRAQRPLLHITWEPLDTAGVSRYDHHRRYGPCHTPWLAGSMEVSNQLNQNPGVVDELQA